MAQCYLIIPDQILRCLTINAEKRLDFRIWVCLVVELRCHIKLSCIYPTFLDVKMYIEAVVIARVTNIEVHVVAGLGSVE